MNKDKLLKYKQYITEKIDPWKLKIGIKSFNRLPEESITIHGDLKDLSAELTKEFSNINLPYTKLLSFGGIEVDIKIIQSNRNYSSVDWIKFLRGDNEILIEVEPNYDINYVISTIIHEIRHMIDFTDENLNSGLSSFDIDKNLRRYNIDIFNEFYVLVYISLEHELVARNNQIYPYIKFKNLKKEDSIQILKQSFIWKALQMLKEFDYEKFINKFDQQVLINITNSFIKDCLYDHDQNIENESDLIKFYKVWDEYFNEVSNNWEELLLREVELVYERKAILEPNLIRYEFILKNIWEKLKSNYRNKQLK